MKLTSSISFDAEGATAFTTTRNFKIFIGRKKMAMTKILIYCMSWSYSENSIKERRLTRMSFTNLSFLTEDDKERYSTKKS
jgi:hypothetical protein